MERINTVDISYESYVFIGHIVLEKYLFEFLNPSITEELENKIYEEENCQYRVFDVKVSDSFFGTFYKKSSKNTKDKKIIVQYLISDDTYSNQSIAIKSCHMSNLQYTRALVQFDIEKKKSLEDGKLKTSDLDIVFHDFD